MHWARFVVLSTILRATHSITFNHGELPGMRPKNTKSWWRWSELSAERKLQHVRLKNSLQGVWDKGRRKKILANLFCTNTCVILICADFVTFSLSSSGWQMDVSAFWTEGRHTEGTYESWLSDKQKPAFREFLVWVDVCVHVSMYVPVHRLNVPLVYIWFSAGKISHTPLVWLKWIIFGNEK